MTLLKCVARLVRKVVTRTMAKNGRKMGHSARNGNAASPYQKYKKKPYRYSAAYYDWRGSVTRSKSSSGTKDYKTTSRDKVRNFKLAAE